MAKRKKNLNERLKDYEDFYERTFKDHQILLNEIYNEGGSTSLNKFKETSKGKISSGYYEAMFERKKVKQKDKLGTEIFERFIKKENITLNSKNRIIVRTGYKFQFGNKTYKGGMYVPKQYFTRRY